VPHTYHVLRNQSDPASMREELEAKIAGARAGARLRDLTFDAGVLLAYATVDYDDFSIEAMKRVSDAIDATDTKILLDTDETVSVRG
jgi:hypothetical protein